MARDTDPVPVVCANLDLLVTAAPGTGSTSLLRWAADLPGAVMVPSATQACPTSVDRKHATIAELRSVGLLSPPSVGIVLTSTRDPFDYWHAEWFRTRTRWVVDAEDPQSWVHDVPGMIQRIQHAVELCFADWLEVELGQRADQGDQWHLNPGHVGEADVVLRMECLEQDLQTMLPQVAAVGGSIPHHNVTGGRPPHATAYTERARWIVGQIHGPDLQRFGYTFPSTT